MGQIIPSSLKFPDQPPAGDIAVINNVAVFFNFVAGQSGLKPDHVKLIPRLVAFLIAQIDQLGFSDKSISLLFHGQASATGKTDKNLSLSRDRAAAVGAAFVKEFDRQKSQSRLASGMVLIPNIDARGDTEARAELATLQNTNPKFRNLSSKDVDDIQGGDRRVFVGITDSHEVVNDDKKVECRQLLTAVVKVEHKPANLLEQTIDDVEKSVKSAFEGHGVAKFIVDQIVAQITTPLKDMVKAGFKELTADFPEIAALLFAADFIIPSDIQNVFEFRDNRGKTAQYVYTGSQNKIGFGIIDALCKILGLLKWVTKTIEAFERFAEQAKRQGKNIEKILDVLSKLKKVQSASKKIFDMLSKKGSILRTIIGDDMADLIVKVVNDNLVGKVAIDATDFAPVAFDIDGVFDVATFRGPARTEVREFLLESKVFLDFLGTGPEGLLGFAGHSLMFGKFAFNNNLLGFGISKGALVGTKVLSPS